MTETGLITAVAATLVGGDKASRNAAAKTFVQGAIKKVGRTPNVDFNRTYVKFTLKSGVKTYTIGKTILKQHSNLWNMQNLHHTDSLGHPIHIFQLGRFNAVARGGSSSGRPSVATIHSWPAILEVYPSPSQDYEVMGYVPRKIVKLSDIPDDYHDVVETIAIAKAAASKEPEVAVALAGSDLREVQNESKTGWQGDQPLIDIPLYNSENTGNRPTSRNLTGE